MAGYFVTITFKAHSERDKDILDTLDMIVKNKRSEYLRNTLRKGMNGVLPIASKKQVKKKINITVDDIFDNMGGF